MSARQFIFSPNEAARANFQWAGHGLLVFCRLLSLAWLSVLGTFVSLKVRAAVDTSKLPPASTIAVDFTSQIEPIFRQHCYACHGAEKQKNNFRLDLRAAAFKGGDDYAPDIVPGNSAGSPLVQFVAGLVEDRVMPKKGERLTSEQVGLLRAWIDQGAKWPEGSPNTRGATHYWAFQPLLRSQPPPVKNKTWPLNPIDHFILARLEAKGLAPAPPADKRTLLRRATFDLHGLPPTPVELEAFLADKSPDAFAKAVNRLLASPRYGERWGRHWLDVVRFSESHGFEYDKMRENAWRYRDYVIQSLNDDKPYPQFVKEQIAGDALEPATRDGIVATGFLVAGPYDEAGNTSVSALLKARIREEELEEMIAAVSQTFLGLTVNCARCHDHKFDPIPQVDYYRMKAVFEGVRHGQRALLTVSEQTSRDAEIARINGRVADAEKRMAAIEQTAAAMAASNITRGETAQGLTFSVPLPQPMARWTFETNANDSIGALHGTLRGGATISKGRLKLNGKDAFVQTEPLPRDVKEKTLEAWVFLANLEQGGGGVISLESKEAGFDAIVFGEREPRKWIAGSSFFQRTRDLTAPAETAQPTELVHVAAVYHSDNRIGFYRNGAPYSDAYLPSGENASVRTYGAHEARVLFGLRHTGAGNGFLSGEIEEARLYDRALSAEEIAVSARAGPPAITRKAIRDAMTLEQRQEHEALLAELARQRDALKAFEPVPQVYAANSRQPEPTFVLARGDVEKKRAQVTAGGLSSLNSVSSEFGLPADAPETRRRLKLAEWMANPENPLVPRVMVNRIWHYHFGRGIVGTPNDFGVNGEQPSHPELLDYLASEFLEQGGSIKQLHRLIMLSKTYQQSSPFHDKAATLDSEDRLLWRYPLRRLEGEAIRDAVLSVSGELNEQRAGPSYRPFRVFVSNSHFYDLTDAIGPEFNRRTVYRMNVQSARDPLLNSLDCPDPSTKTPARSITTTPIQALGMMNNSFVQRQASRFAERVKHEAGKNVSDQIKLAYQLAFARKPTPEETTRAATLANGHGMESVCWVLFNASEFCYVR